MLKSGALLIALGIAALVQDVHWEVPRPFPRPAVPADNAMSRPDDIGKFRVPTPGNIAVTAPYMHDGSIESLEEVIDHYAAGGRTIGGGPDAGVGRNNPDKAANVPGFTLTAAEKRDLVAFLESLTDNEFLKDPRLSDPWKQ